MSEQTVSLDQLRKIDGSFCLISKMDRPARVAALCSIDAFRKDGIVFVKNKKFYQKLIGQMGANGRMSNIGVVLQESFYQKNDGDAQQEHLSRFRFHATVKSVDVAMSLFSKLFFDLTNTEGSNRVGQSKRAKARIHPDSYVADHVTLGAGVDIEEGAVIHAGCTILSNSRIGKNTILYPNVVVYPGCTIGENCIVHANTTIGSDGFRYILSGGRHLKVWHLGGVMIEDDVEIGSNTSIDQGTFSPTVIGEGTKIDNQVHIAHNCQLGKGVVVCGQVGLAGSVVLGDYSVLAGCVNVAPGIKIGAYAQIGGMAGVTSDVPEKAVYGGHPARPLNEWLKSSARVRRMALKGKTKG